jgi:hypothetical protein
MCVYIHIYTFEHMYAFGSHFMNDLPRRTLDPLLSKSYFYWARCVELRGKSALAGIRNELLSAYRTAVLKHDQIGQVNVPHILQKSTCWCEINVWFGPGLQNTALGM